MEVSQHSKYFCEFCGKYVYFCLLDKLAVCSEEESKKCLYIEEYKYLDEYEEEGEEQEEDECGKEDYEEEKTKQLPKELLEYLQLR
ncbi:hypothetical protein KY285_010453 [Solanum tuberosum]|nr:hypothetical protein KY289_011008 [Solanum tuberosum]KAH0734746.1 hypothetical protein KY285_010453 [Solanum tuberosum]